MEDIKGVVMETISSIIVLKVVIEFRLGEDWHYANLSVIRILTETGLEPSFTTTILNLPDLPELTVDQKNEIISVAETWVEEEM